MRRTHFAGIFRDDQGPGLMGSDRDKLPIATEKKSLCLLQANPSDQLLIYERFGFALEPSAT